MLVLFTSNKFEYVKFLNDKSWCSKLAYLSDIFQHLNNLNTSMQGKKENILTSVNKINVFKRKLIIWKKHVLRGNCEMFPILVQRTNLVDILPLIINHLESLINTFSAMLVMHKVIATRRCCFFIFCHLYSLCSILCVYLHNFFKTYLE